MATILIVDDRTANREYLVTLLGYGGHRLLEAADGEEALGIVKTTPLDMVIADILMPTMDGYEFVRHLRADPAVAATPVIFFTAHYHEREARNLADACGVSHVLSKPCEPEVVLRTVDAALGGAPIPGPLPPVEEFDREHLRLLTDKLSRNADELRTANERLSALIDLGLQLGSEHDLRRLLENFCRMAREIVGARYAVTGIVEGAAPPLRYLFTSGMAAETASRLDSPDPRQGVLRTVLGEGRCLRLLNPGGDPVALGFAASHPPIHSWLGVPVASPTRVYGWLGLVDKVGAEAFSDEDERLADILAAQVGRIYENGSLYADVLHHAGELEREVAEREQAQAALVESETCNRAILESAVDGLITINREGLIREFNPAAEKIFGYRREEVLGKAMADLVIPPSLREGHRRGFHRLLATGESSILGKTVELVGMRADGMEFPVELSVTSFRVAGEPMFTGFLRDITARKQAEEALRASEERTRLLLDSTAEAIFGIDLEGNCTLANPACARLLGYAEPHQLLDKYMHALCHHTRVDGTPYPVEESRIYRTFQRGEAAHVEDEVFWRADGSSFPVEYWSYPIRREGQIVGAVVTFLDITERKHLEKQFRHAQQRLQYVVASSPAVLFTLAIAEDRIQGVSWISDNLGEILGYSREAALSPDWWLGNIHPEDRERTIGETYPELLRHGWINREYRFRHGDGRYRWTRGEMRLIRDGAGQAVEVVGSWSDITERKHLEDQFRQSQKMEAVGQLAGGVAHDFNNLLTIISGYGELVLANVAAEDPRREMIGEIVAAGDRAAGLTRQLLAFSRKTILEPKVLDLRVVVADVDKMLRRIIGEDIQLSVAADNDAGAVRADPGQIEQVILNLAVNARDAMPRGGRLTIEVRNAELDETYARDHADVRPGPHVMLAVSDTGCGMDAALLAHMWEPFFTTKGARGTGLGLATVYGIIKQSGGHVAVYSEVGHGTTFKVYLPRVEEQPTSGKSHLGLDAMPRGGETILLVEDEGGVRALCRHVLQVCGYTVLEARDGVEGLRIAGQPGLRVDLLVTDVVMPQMGGREFAVQVGALQPDAKVLFLSGYTDDAVVRHGILEADVAFLHKPFSPASLAVKVREVLDGK